MTAIRPRSTPPLILALPLAIYGAKWGRIRHHGPDAAPQLTCGNVIRQHPTDRSDGPTDQKVSSPQHSGTAAPARCRRDGTGSVGNGPLLPDVRGMGHLRNGPVRERSRAYGASMGFFAGRPRHVPDDEVQAPQAMPEWFGPPRGVMPGYAPTRAVVFRTDDVILIAGRFDVYRTGVEFSLQLQVRIEDDTYDIPWELHHRHGRAPDGELPDEFLRFGIQFADGSAWSNIDDGFPMPPTPPTGPVVVGQGGGGGGGSWAMNYWLWPLPPEGPLTFVAEWPKHQIAECSATVDASEIRQAVAHVEDLWST